jgi:ankyrin repeat protein
MKLIRFFALLSLPVWASNSPIADAAMKGDKTALKTLIQQKSDVNAQQGDGSTAVQWAAYRNDPEMADMLISAGANVKTPNREGMTPLALASMAGNAPLIEKLIKAGADPNENGAHGETPLMFASRNGNPEAIKALLNHKAAVNTKEALRGTTALMWAAEQGHAAAVKILIQAGADLRVITKPDSRGGTAYLAPPIQARLRQESGAGGRPRSAPLGVRVAADGSAAVGVDGRPIAERADFGDFVANADAAAAAAAFGRQQNTEGGGLTALIMAAREGYLDTVQALVEAGANVNQVSNYGWTPLLAATQNRNYKVGKYLLDHGADPTIANKGGWSPLYIATDNRNIEGGDYPVRAPDMDHLEYIKLLLDKGANVNARVCGAKSSATQCVGDSTETRTIFTMQWLYEDGATPFWRAAQSGDVQLMKLLLARGADPKIATAHKVTPLAVAAGIGWVEGITFEWSEAENLEAVKLCLDAGIDPNIADDEGRTALHGAAHKGRNQVVQLLVDRGANLLAHDLGSRDTVNGAMLGVTWVPLHYSQGLVRVGVQSAIPHPETEALIRKLMKERNLPIPADITSSICLTKGANGCQ